MTDNTRFVWECKIGSVNGVEVPPGADFPMRQAIRKAYIELTGEEPDAIFSGWGSKFDEIELQVINKKPYLPNS